jgi:alkanesulfonate monooxygenase SsuD/methylene tetrahydromethanopterin reductase-like flavin-dependent oxidoreductase (luciferase family)
MYDLVTRPLERGSDEQRHKEPDAVKIGIGLPTHIPGCHRDLFLEWARAADEGASTLVVADLVTTPAWDAFASLAAAAAVTERVRLMTNVFVLPLRNAGLAAKEAATIDVLSNGRLTLGIGAGGKKPVLFGITQDANSHANFPDYAAAPADPEGRSTRLDEQIAYMKQLWRGESPMTGVPPVGPNPVQTGGPELLAGTFAPAAIRRAASWCDGFACFNHGAHAETVDEHFRVATNAWHETGRAGVPRVVGSCLLALGPRAVEGKGEYLARHYHHLSPDGLARIDAAIGAPGDDAARRAAKVYSDIGYDELVFVPMIPTVDQVHRLLDLNL